LPGYSGKSVPNADFGRSADFQVDFQVCCIADFQIREVFADDTRSTFQGAADLEIADNSRFGNRRYGSADWQTTGRLAPGLTPGSLTICSIP
jgi:hypothetical protein